MSFPETSLATIDTPAVLVDLDIARSNIARFQAYADAHGIAVRPHIKTHKLPAIAEMQLAAGAIGITCQKVSEAEAMIAGSDAIRDVLITYNILGGEKLEHLKALAKKVKLRVVADNRTVVDGLSAAFAGEAAPWLAWPLHTVAPRRPWTLRGGIALILSTLIVVPVLAFLAVVVLRFVIEAGVALVAIAENTERTAANTSRD